MNWLWFLIFFLTLFTELLLCHSIIPQLAQPKINLNRLPYSSVQKFILFSYCQQHQRCRIWSLFKSSHFVALFILSNHFLRRTLGEVEERKWLSLFRRYRLNSWKIRGDVSPVWRWGNHSEDFMHSIRPYIDYCYAKVGQSFTDCLLDQLVPYLIVFIDIAYLSITWFEIFLFGSLM